MFGASNRLFALSFFGKPIERGAAVTTTTQTVSVADSADPVITGGDAFSYTVQYTNTGGINATSVQVQVTVDASLSITGSSGTGWSLSTVGQVVTATLASAAPGAANPITINVTTGGSALTASTSAAATAANATTANGSQTTVVNLVTKDATMGVYFPANTTEASNFITRKGLSIPVPTSIWNLQEASGNPADSGAGGITLTASGTGLAYQQTDAALTRKVITFTDGSTGSFKSTSASLPDISATDCLTFFFIKASTPAATRKVIGHGTTVSAANLVNTGKVQAISGANVANAANIITGAWKPWAVKTVHGVSTTFYSDSEKVTPTFGSPTGKTVFFGSNGATSPTMSGAYGLQWPTTVSDADYKAFLQALGLTITWT